MGTWKLLLVGIFIHTILFYSIFDIYFTSPIVHGMSPHVSPKAPPAKRLVLFSADGLRADKMFQLVKGETNIPYLRKIIENKGVWGVSHTRVPTESRPGHVALIAGFYEDVSAIAKGWKENPVEFDSVFNQSRYTWSWGSPDILPMFAKGASGSHVFTSCYPAEYENFGGSARSRSSLDTWVFDKFKEFLNSSHSDPDLQKKLHEDKIVFFLHLLGIDTNGHAMKPYSSAYLDNIRLVDKGIEEIVGLLENFYNNDGQTAYVVTSDHGMTDWGSHGAGHPSETLTPIVAWGAGVRGPKEEKDVNRFRDNFQTEWKLRHVKRTDINQADVAPLMSALIGIPYPINSVGLLPHDYLHTAVTEEELAEMMYANVRQILEQFQVKMELKKSTTLSVTFRPFRFLGGLSLDNLTVSELTPVIIAEKHRHFGNLMKNGRFQDVIKESEELIDIALKGLTYYQTYDRLFLGASVVCGFVGWMAYVLTVIFEDHSGIIRPLTVFEKQSQPLWRSEFVIKMFFYILGILVTALLYVQSLAWTNYLYCLIPVVLWMVVTLRLNILSQAFTYTINMQNRGRFIFAVLACLVGLEILVVGFFYREMFSIGLVFIGIIAWLQSASPKMTLLKWTFSCLLLAVFPMLPVVTGQRNVHSVISGGAVIIVGVLLFLIRLNRVKGIGRWSINIIAFLQICMIGVSTYFSGYLVISGLTSWQHIISWSFLALSFILPLCGPTLVYPRLLIVFLGFVTPFILLSISYEVLFVASLGFLLFQWLNMENGIDQPTGKSRDQTGGMLIDFVDKSTGRHLGCRFSARNYLVISDIQRSFYFIFLILTAFFGTGNIASINSFDPASVLCFVSVFSPFTMGALLLLKVVIPFILVSCTLQAIHVITKLPIQGLCLLILLMSDCMAMHFFFLVQDYGSWLDIGTSISHYVMVMTMIIFIMLLFGVSNILTTWRLRIFSIGDKKRT